MYTTDRFIEWLKRCILSDFPTEESPYFGSYARPSHISIPKWISIKDKKKIFSALVASNMLPPDGKIFRSKYVGSKEVFISVEWGGFSHKILENLMIKKQCKTLWDI